MSERWGMTEQSSFDGAKIPESSRASTPSSCRSSSLAWKIDYIEEGEDVFEIIK